MRLLSQIAKDVYADWGHVSPYAAPYLAAMASMHSIKENYYADSGRYVVSYFLANAAHWRGDVAKSVKAELKAMLKGAY